MRIACTALSTPAPCRAANAARMYPECATELYASIRRTLRCLKAKRLPTNIVTMARTAITAVHVGAAVGIPSRRMRKRIAKIAALGATERKAAALVGAPWYASGVQKWNGAAETLKAKPETKRTRPTRATGESPPV